MIIKIDKQSNLIDIYTDEDVWMEALSIEATLWLIKTLKDKLKELGDD